MNETATYHICTYLDWRNNGRTECCGVRVFDLPVTDETGTREARMPGQRLCRGTALAATEDEYTDDTGELTAAGERYVENMKRRRKEEQ